MVEFTSEQKSRFRDLADRLSPGQQVRLDPRDEGDRGVIEHFLDLSNKRSNRYPALHKALASGTPLPDGEHDLRFVDLGATSDGRATARAWHASHGRSVVSGSTAVVFDSDGGEPLAYGDATRVGESFTPAVTDHETAGQAGDSLTGLAFFHSQQAPEAPPAFGVAMTRRDGLEAMGSVTTNVIAPKLRVQGHTQIKICVGRGPTKPGVDADYFFLEPQNLQKNPPLIVPFQGTASLPGTIEVEPGTTKIKGLTVASQVYAQGTHHDLVKPTPTQAALQVTVPDPAGKPGELSWIFKYDEKSYEKTESLLYGQGTGEQLDITGSFFFQFSVPVQGLSAPAVFSICSTDYPDPSSENCTEIPNIDFWFHCLAAGTEVTLADGSRLPIESVDNSMRVRTGTEGGTLGVEATTRGGHFETGPASGVCELVTEGGRKLTLTMGHPVATPNGLVLAGDLAAAGATVLTEAGPEGVASIERVASEEMFCNLKLVDEEDRANGVLDSVSTFLANGIVVGDAIALSNQYRTSRVNPDYMLHRLPKPYHRDYESAIEDALASC